MEGRRQRVQVDGEVLVFVVDHDTWTLWREDHDDERAALQEQQDERVLGMKDELRELVWFRATFLDGSTGIAHIDDVYVDPIYERAELMPITEEEARLELAKIAQRSN